MNNEELLTRERILHEAYALFLSLGYENTSVQAIIDKVGIAKGTFYHHFRGKESMLVTLVESMTQKVIGVVQPLVDDPDLGALQKMIGVSSRGLAKKAEAFGSETLLLAQQIRQRSNRLLSDSLQRILTLWIRPLYLTIVRQGVAEGVFHVLDAEIATDIVLGLQLSMEDRILDCFVDALNGTTGALDRLLAIYAAMEQAIQRILGAAEGSLPIFSGVDIRGLMNHYRSTLTSQGGPL